MPKIALLLVICLLLCSCFQGQDKTFETETETESATISETVVETLSESSAEAHTTSIAAEIETVTEKTAETCIEYGEYVYNPPQEVLDTHFYCDDIEAKIDCQNVLDGDFEIGDIWNDPEAEKALYEALTKNLPAEIVDNVTQNLPFPYYSDDFLSKYNYKVDEIFSMKYDFNSDGIDDYFLNVSLKEGAEFFMSENFFERIFLYDSGSYVPVEVPSLESSRSGCLYILSTETNGLKDIFVYHNSNTPTIKYDGVSAYGGAVSADENHTFLDGDILPGNILHINLNISVIDAPVGEYYTAIKFEDNPYIKNNLLYTCYPDGTPRSYIETPYGEPSPTYFSTAIEGYDFYVELNEDIPDDFHPENYYLPLYMHLLEIKYVAVN